MKYRHQWVGSMRMILFLGFLVLSVLVPVGLAQARTQTSVQPDLQRAESLVRAESVITGSFVVKQ